MSAVLQLRPAPGPAESLAQRRVRLGSRALAFLFTGLFGLTVAVGAVAVVAAIFYRGELLWVGPRSFLIGEGAPGMIAFSSLPLPQRSAYALAAVARLAPVAMIFFTLRDLFGGYGRGEVFSAPATRAFGRLGAWLCIYAVSPFACHLALSATGYEIDRNWMHLTHLQAFVIGLLVLVIGQVMHVGREIEEDRKGFV